LKFKNCKTELTNIRKILNKKGFQLIILYGRRRIGKTELILKSTEDFKRIYYLAIGEKNLDRFYNVCKERFPEISNLKKDYEILIDFLKDKVDVIIIDEFQNLIQEDFKILNLFQNIIDQILKSSNLKLFLVGSSISIITSKILDYSSPLYGRRTGSIKLKPINFFDFYEFFPNLTFIELMEIYGFADGIPHYLNFIKLPFWDWLSEELKSPSSIFRDEVDFLMRYEFKNPSLYKLILEAIASGKTKLNEIKNFIGLKRTDLSPYIKNLINVEMIYREIPMFENIHSRRGRYYIKDNFLKFWFRFLYPNLSMIEEGIFDVKVIRNEYNVYLGQVFEDVIKNFIIRSKIIEFTKIGRWWWKDVEIDLVAINELKDDIYFIECKWSDKINSFEIMKKLYEKAKSVQWKKDKRKEIFLIFAKSFSRKISIFKKRKVLCFDIDDIERVIKNRKDE